MSRTSLHEVAKSSPRSQPLLSGFIKEGFLTKQGRNVKSWRKRWFVLNDSLCTLTYYKTREMAQKESVTAAKAKGQIFFTQEHFIEDAPELENEKKFSFKIRGPERILFVHALNESEKNEWMEAMRFVLPQNKKIRDKEAKDRIINAEKEAKKMQEDILGATPGWDTNIKKL